MDAKLRKEIAKLVLMMTSNHDQEAIAAIRAIERKLLAVNSSMHDLAALISGGAVNSAGGEVSTSNDALVSFCFERAMQLLPRERAFVEDVYYRMTAYPRYPLSVKQRKWLASIYAKLKLYGA